MSLILLEDLPYLHGSDQRDKLVRLQTSKPSTLNISKPQTLNSPKPETLIISPNPLTLNIHIHWFIPPSSGVCRTEVED